MTRYPPSIGPPAWNSAPAGDPNSLTFLTTVSYWSRVRSAISARIAKAMATTTFSIWGRPLPARLDVFTVPRGLVVDQEQEPAQLPARSCEAGYLLGAMGRLPESGSRHRSIRQMRKRWFQAWMVIDRRCSVNCFGGTGRRQGSPRRSWPSGPG